MIDPARSFDRAAAEYERGRPDWPEAVLDLVGVPPEATVLDLGAGTGKLTRVLVRRYAHVVAVEPLPAMRTELERQVPAAEALDGRAEAIPLADGSVDAVFVAQAFHWFANDEAVAEIARVLRPGGVLALLWNEASELAPSPLPDAYERRLAGLRPSEERESDWIQKALASGPFGELRSGGVEHEQRSARETVLANAASVSWVASRPDEERRRALAELAELLPEGEYRFPIRANVTSAERL